MTPLRIDDDEPITPVIADSPTRQQAPRTAPRTSAPRIPGRPRRAPKAQSPAGVAASTATPAVPVAGAGLIDRALGSRQRAVSSRLPGEIWDALNARAEDLGVPARLLLTDAIVHALEHDPAELTARARRTRRREKLAQLARDDEQS